MNIIIGLGNILFSDEGIGIHVIKELEKRGNIKNTLYVDMGTSSFDLDYFITPDLDKIAVIDCLIAKDTRPGEVFRIRIEELNKRVHDKEYSLHQLKFVDIVKILSINNNLPDILILGIAPFDTKTLSMDLSYRLNVSFKEIVLKVENSIINFFEN